MKLTDPPRKRGENARKRVGGRRLGARKTSGKGNKAQGAQRRRNEARIRRRADALQRRLPKRGFVNVFREEMAS